jgi:hypothetical protein
MVYKIPHSNAKRVQFHCKTIMRQFVLGFLVDTIYGQDARLYRVTIGTCHLICLVGFF